jgi:hypothetical protein
MGLFALNGVNKGAFSHHWTHHITPAPTSTNQIHKTIFRLRKECITGTTECLPDCRNAGTLE